MLLRQVSRKVLRIASVGLSTVAVGGSAYFLYRNDFDVSSIGAMRLARAGIAVGIFSFVPFDCTYGIIVCFLLRDYIGLTSKGVGLPDDCELNGFLLKGGHFLGF
jgi:hypothetical protein